MSKVLPRVMAALLGGYCLANLGAVAFSLLLSTWLSSSRADGVMAAMLLSFLLYALAVLWVFAARSAGRACLGILLICLLCGAVIMAAITAGAGVQP